MEDGTVARLIGMITCKTCGWYRVITNRDNLDRVYFQPQVQRDLRSLRSLASERLARASLSDREFFT